MRTLIILSVVASYVLCGCTPAPVVEVAPAPQAATKSKDGGPEASAGGPELSVNPNGTTVAPGSKTGN